MLGLGLNKVDSTKIRGFVEIEIVNPTTGIHRVIKNNTVTNIGKLLMLSKSANDILMEFGGSPYGRVRSVDLLGSYVGGKVNTIDSAFNVKAKQDNGLNLYLANLDSGVTLTEDTKYVDLLDSNFDVDYTKVVGFANSRDVSANTREGVQDFTRPNHMINDKCVANRWKFAEGVATGTFNHLLIMPGIHGGFKTNGIYLKKCISRINQFEDVADFGNMFIIPGATGLTGPNEILLNYNRNNINRWRHNLATGEVTQVESNDIGYNVPMYETYDQVYVDGFLYLLCTDGRIRKINTTTGDVVTSSNILGSYVTHGASMFYNGTNLITMNGNNTYEGSYDDRSRVYTVNINTLSASSVYKVNWTGWGGIPAGWSRNRMIVKKCGAYYFVHHGYEVIMCTDLMDIKGSRVNAFLAHPDTHYVSDGVDIWTIEKGVHNFSYESIEDNKSNTPDNLLYIRIYNRVRDNDTYRDYNYTTSGIWIGKLWCGNLISFVKLATPITKSATDIMHVAYGYEFV